MASLYKAMDKTPQNFQLGGQWKLGESKKRPTNIFSRHYAIELSLYVQNVPFCAHIIVVFTSEKSFL